MQDYRAQLYDYLKNRMYAVAPNLTVLVGELIGARLISHAGICGTKSVEQMNKDLVLNIKLTFFYTSLYKCCRSDVLPQKYSTPFAFNLNMLDI